VVVVGVGEECSVRLRPVFLSRLLARGRTRRYAPTPGIRDVRAQRHILRTGWSGACPVH